MKKRNKEGSGFVFMVPALIIYLSVIVIPVFYSMYISLFKWNGVAEMEFVGLGNYITLFTNDPVFLIALKNNMIWIILTICVTMTVSLMFAVLLNKNFRGRTVFRGLFYFPAVVAPVAIAVIWRFIYNPQIGFINQFCKALGINFKQTWTSNPSTAIFAVFFASLWAGIGQPMILFLAGLQGVSPDVLEAATIDGAGPVKKFFLVTIPLMKQTFVMVSATLITAAMKVYDIVAALTNGGPNNSTEMLATYMYAQTFQYNNVGMGTTVAVLMVLMMLVVIIPFVKFTASEN